MCQRWLILAAVVTGLALDLLDITVVNVAVPHLMAEFGTDIDTVQWRKGWLTTTRCFPNLQRGCGGRLPEPVTLPVCGPLSPRSSACRPPCTPSPTPLSRQ